MRIVFAFSVMGWVVGLVFAMTYRDYGGMALLLLYMVACVFGVVARGWTAGLLGWPSIWLGGTAAIAWLFHLPVSAGLFAFTMFAVAFAIFMGNTLAGE